VFLEAGLITVDALFLILDSHVDSLGHIGEKRMLEICFSKGGGIFHVVEI
jgi:hypothetical protein